jgi:RecA-family ATPase
MGVPVKMVVIDTLAGGNENGPEDMGQMVRSMDQIRAETGSWDGFIHHSGKDAAKGSRGHTSLRAAWIPKSRCGPTRPRGP